MDVLGYAGKRVLVSGCFSGMGNATARMLIDLGAEVHGIDYKQVDLPLASCTQIDLRDPDQIRGVASAIGGRVDALFNCAGLPQTATPTDVMKVNYAGTRLLTETIIPLMPEGGAIASISSNGGLGWSRRMPVLMELIAIADYADQMAWIESHAEQVSEGYSFSKELIIAWTLLMSNRLVDRKLRINCTMPGPTATPMMTHFVEASGQQVIDAAMQPTNRHSTPEEQAGAMVFLNSALATFVSGVSLPVDGGFMGGVATGQVDLSVMMSNANKG